MKRNKHGAVWWLFIGWWWYPVKWIFFDLPVFITRKIIETVKKGKIEASPKPTSAQPQTQEPIKNEPYVYVTLKGKKFHYDLLCPGLRYSNTFEMELSKARKAGYKACDKCCWDYLHK